MMKYHGFATKALAVLLIRIVPTNRKGAFGWECITDLVIFGFLPSNHCLLVPHHRVQANSHEDMFCEKKTLLYCIVSDLYFLTYHEFPFLKSSWPLFNKGLSHCRWVIGAGIFFSKTVLGGPGFNLFWVHSA